MSQDKFTPKGNIEIWKVYSDGSKELHWNDHNVITSGMGVGLAHLYAVSGSTSIVDYQILNYQVGTSGDLNNYGVSSYKLQNPLDGVRPYGLKSFVRTESLQPIQNGTRVVAEDFVRIPYTNIHRLSKTAVKYTIVLDENTANVEDELNEIGLFMRNPTGLTPHSPMLVAYRPFKPIKKTKFFTLVFLWTLQF